MQSLISLFVLLLLGVGCAQKSSKVSLKLTSSFAFGGANLASYSQGGLMVWGMSGDGRSFAKVMNDTDALQLELPNGVWEFYAMAWQNTNNQALDGTTALRCAKSPITKLDGVAASPVLNLTQTDCDIPMFRGRATTLGSSQLQLRFCEAVELVNGSSNLCTNDRTQTARVSDKAPVMSVRVRLAEYSQNLPPMPGPGLTRCIPMPSSLSGDAVIANKQLIIPGGNPDRVAASPFRLELELFYDSTDCTSSLPPTLIRLNNGAVTDVPGKKYLPGVGTGHMLSLAVPDVAVCRDRGQLAPFAGGDGSVNFPHLICSGDQLMNIHDDPSFLSRSYRLSTDVDLNVFAQGFIDPARLPANSQCWNFGMNWQPLGASFAAPPACTYTPGQFLGSFDGNGHSISNLRMRLEQNSQVGFIGQWTPLFAESFIRDLKFDGAEVSGLSQVGVVVGAKPNATFATISNINIVNMDLETRSNGIAQAGGVIGVGFRTDLRDILVEQSEMHVQGSEIGGVFGSLENSRRIERIHSRVNIYPQYVGASTNGIGGVGGDFKSTITEVNGVNTLSHEGVIVANGYRIGGIFGLIYNHPSTTQIRNIYANSVINSSLGFGGEVGGVFGYWDTTAQLANVLFSGMITDKCISSCNRGLISGSTLNFSSDVQKVFSYSQNFSGVTGTGDNLGGAPIPVTEAQLHDATFEATVFNAAPFIHRQNDLPRFLSERHICSSDPIDGVSPRDSLAIQATRRGGDLNPMVICRRQQWSELNALTATAAAPKRVLIAAPVSLLAPYTPVTINPHVTVDGKQGMIYGYTESGGAAGGTHRAPIAANNGTVVNLIAANMFVLMNTAGPSSSVAGLVSFNAGTLRDVAFVGGIVSSTDPTGNTSVAGAVFNNSGILDRVQFYGTIQASRNLAGLVHTNSGTVFESTAGGMINLNASVSSSFGGFVHTNQPAGRVLRGRLESKLWSDVNSLEQAGQFVHTNAGEILNAEVSSETRWEVKFASIANASFAYNNPGTIRRVAHKGLFVNIDPAYAATPTAASGKPIYLGAGAAQGVTGVTVMGNLVLMGNGGTMTCSGSTLSTSLVPTSGSIYDYGSGWWLSDIGLTRHLWVLAQTNGQYQMAKVVSVISSTAPTFSFVIDRSCAQLDSLGTANSLMLIQGFSTNEANLVGNTSTFPFNGLIYGQDLPVTTAYNNSVWAGEFYNLDVEADRQAVVQYYFQVLQGSKLPAPRAWEFAPDYGMELMGTK